MKKTIFFYRNIQKLQNILSEMIEAIVEEFLQPSKNGLIPKKD